MAIIKNPATIIQQGGFDIAPYITANSSNHYPMFGSQALFPSGLDLKLNLSKMQGVEYLFLSNLSSLASIELTLSETLTNFAGVFMGAANIKKIVLNSSILAVKGWRNAFNGCSALEEIAGEINLSDSTNNDIEYMFWACGALKEVRFAENSIGFNFGHGRYGSSLNSCPLLSNESIISVANALQEGTSALSLTLHATPKAACSTILGVVSQEANHLQLITGGNWEYTINKSTFASAVNDAGGEYSFSFNGTSWENNSTVVNLADYGITISGTPASGDMLVVDFYHRFTADQNGDTYLDEFITDVKGWSLA